MELRPQIDSFYYRQTSAIVSKWTKYSGSEITRDFPDGQIGLPRKYLAKLLQFKPSLGVCLIGGHLLWGRDYGANYREYLPQIWHLRCLVFFEQLSL